MNIPELMEQLGTIDPDRITLEAVSKLLNLPKFAAKMICDTAVRRGEFSKTIEADGPIYKLRFQPENT